MEKELYGKYENEKTGETEIVLKGGTKDYMYDSDSDSDSDYIEDDGGFSGFGLFGNLYGEEEQTTSDEDLVSISEKTLTAIADSIRTRMGTSKKMTPLEMPDNIMSIKGNVEKSNTLSFTSAEYVVNNIDEYKQFDNVSAVIEAVSGFVSVSSAKDGKIEASDGTTSYNTESTNDGGESGETVETPTISFASPKVLRTVLQYSFDNETWYNWPSVEITSEELKGVATDGDIHHSEFKEQKTKKGDVYLNKDEEGETFEYLLFDGIELTQDNPTVYLRGENETFAHVVTMKDKDGKEEYEDVRGSFFIINGAVVSGGSIQSLLTFDAGRKSVPEYCFSGLFERCEGLLAAPELPAHVLGRRCYHRMFAYCSALLSVPELPATDISEGCYCYMFTGCLNLKKAQGILPATKLAVECYYGMFSGCSDLSSIPVLPAKNMENDCYNSMFELCKSLTSVYGIMAEKTATGCFEEMFYMCSKLNLVSGVNFELGENFSYDWLSDVSETGTFVVSSKISIVYGGTGVPLGWNVFDMPEISYDYSTELVTISYSIPDVSFLCFYDGADDEISYEGPFHMPMDGYGKKVRVYASFKNGSAFSFYKYFENYFWIETSKDNPTIGLDLEWKDYSFSTDGVNWHSFMGVGGVVSMEDAGKLFIRKVDNFGYITEPSLTGAGFTFYGDVAIGGCISSLSHGECMPVNYEFTDNSDGSHTCASRLFENCVEITYADNLILNVIGGENCYENLFHGCSNLQKPPHLPATTLSNGCYKGMFDGCSALTTAPVLPATNISEMCYKDMFKGCTSLVNAPELQATNLRKRCYEGMFSGCTGIEYAPELVAVNLQEGCYNTMFHGCSSLRSIHTAASSWDTSCSMGWVDGVADYGKFTRIETTSVPVGIDGVPFGWELADIEFLCFENRSDKSLQSGEPFYLGMTSMNLFGDEFLTTIEAKLFKPTIYYSKDLKRWNTLSFTQNKKTNTVISEDIGLGYGEKVYFYGVNRALTDLSTNKKSALLYTFSVKNDLCVSGDVTTLLSPTGKSVLSKDNDFAFLNLFSKCEACTFSVKLPPEKLSVGCYAFMFRNCTSLDSAPELPATEMTEACYQGMFSKCLGLKYAPELPATKIAKQCYSEMFNSCSALTKAPELPAVELAEGCYEEMFSSCSQLREAPELPATNLVQDCYKKMFSDTSISKISAAFTSWGNNGNEYTSGWVGGIKNGGVFMKNFLLPVMFGEDNIPSKWDVDVPVLCFTFNGGKGTTATVSLSSTLLNAPELYINTNQNCDVFEWEEWTYEVSGDGTFIFDEISLGGEKEPTKLYVAGINDKLSGIEYDTGSDSEFDSEDYVHEGYSNFVISGNVGVKGDVTTLLNPGGLKEFGEKNVFALACLFMNCSSLENFGIELPATKLSFGCYSNMFHGCGSMTKAPELPATSLAQGCYQGMFSNCSMLQTAPNLPGTSLFPGCYDNMFKDCINLTVAPELPATVLAESCYSEMFKGCIRLEYAPFLPAAEMENSCYSYMFAGCESLNYVRVGASELNSTYSYNWLYGVSNEGTLVHPVLSQIDKGASGCPDGWNIEPFEMYVMAEDTIDVISTLQTPPYIEYACVGGKGGKKGVEEAGGEEAGGETPEWVILSFRFDENKMAFVGSVEPNGATVYFRGENNTLCAGESAYTRFNVRDGKGENESFEVGGDLTSLLSRCGLRRLETKNSHAFSRLFYQSLLKRANGVVINLESLSPYCFDRTFAGTHLEDTGVPKIKITATAPYCFRGMFKGSSVYMADVHMDKSVFALEEGCFEGMFEDCTSLENLPVDLFNDALDIGRGSLKEMFKNCSKLKHTQFPAYPWVISESSFEGMFEKCSSIMEFNFGLVPDDMETSERKQYVFPARCFKNMMSGATSLYSFDFWDSINSDFKTEIGDSCFESMFEGCSALESTGGKFIFTNDTSLGTASFKNMFKGCEIFRGTGNIMLPYQLSPYCFYGMFEGCRKLLSLENKPEKPFVELQESCFERMFFGCGQLNSNVEDFLSKENTVLLTKNCCKDMFKGCERIEQSVFLTGRELAEGCYSGMFSGCTNVKVVYVLAEEWDESCAVGWLDSKTEGSWSIFKLETTTIPSGTNGVPSGWNTEVLYRVELYPNIGSQEYSMGHVVVKTTGNSICNDNVVFFPGTEKVFVKAVPNKGYKFNGWSDGDKEAERDLLAVSTSLTAYFEEDIQYFNVNISGEEAGEGTVSVSPSKTVASGTKVTLTAEANDGYEFDYFDLGNKSTSSKNPTELVVYEDKYVTVYWKTKGFSFTAKSNNGKYGYVSVDKPSPVEYGSYVTCTAIPYDGYIFSNWSDGDTANPKTIGPVYSSFNIIAYFTKSK